MTPTEKKLALILTPEMTRRVNLLTRKLMKMEVQRDQWKAHALAYRKQLLEKTK